MYFDEAKHREGSQSSPNTARHKHIHCIVNPTNLM